MNHDQSDTEDEVPLSDENLHQATLTDGTITRPHLPIYVQNEEGNLVNTGTFLDP